MQTQIGRQARAEQAFSEKEIAAFWKRVVKKSDSECWEWRGGKNKLGYGKYGERTVYAHRMSWVINVGAIPQGACVLHRCDNPPCVNPSHLFLGSKAENNRDMAVKRRNQRGETHHRHKLGAEQVCEIRKRYSPRRVTYQQLADEFGVDQSTIFHVVKRQQWTHI